MVSLKTQKKRMTRITMKNTRMKRISRTARMRMERMTRRISRKMSCRRSTWRRTKRLTARSTNMWGVRRAWRSRSTTRLSRRLTSITTTVYCSSAFCPCPSRFTIFLPPSWVSTRSSALSSSRSFRLSINCRTGMSRNSQWSRCWRGRRKSARSILALTQCSRSFWRRLLTALARFRDKLKRKLRSSCCCGRRRSTSLIRNPNREAAVWTQADSLALSRLLISLQSAIALAVKRNQLINSSTSK